MKKFMLFLLGFAALLQAQNSYTIYYDTPIIVDQGLETRYISKEPEVVIMIIDGKRYYKPLNRKKMFYSHKHKRVKHHRRDHYLYYRPFKR